MFKVFNKLAAFGIKAEVLQLTFAAGAVCGMVGMALTCAAIFLIVFASAKLLVLAALAR